MPAYIIFHDSALTEMSVELPVTDNEFLAIQGVSQVKLERYGEEFIEVIKGIKDAQMSTFEITYRFYQQGISPEQISQERELNIATIFSHLAKLYYEGKDIDLMSYISDEEVNEIRKAHKEIEDLSVLKPYFDFCEEKIPYYKIRIALTIIAKELKE